LGEGAQCGRCKQALPAPSRPVDIGSVAEFDAIVSQARVPVFVDFWAPWCGPCRMAAPRVEALAGRNAGRALVLKVDTDALPALAQRYGVRGIPTFAVFRDGRLQSQQSGLVDVGTMERWLASSSARAA